MTTYWKPGSEKPSEQRKEPSSSTNQPKETAEASRNGSKTELSKSVMSMKFMKRKSYPPSSSEENQPAKSSKLESSATDSSAAAAAAAGPSLSSSSSGSSSAAAQVIIVNGVKIRKAADNDRRVINQYPGRRSFGGFNKAVERNYQEVLDEIKYNNLAQRRSKYDINDEEMVERYKNLVGLPRGPNQSSLLIRKSSERK
jgi:hypothetical protein